MPQNLAEFETNKQDRCPVVLVLDVSASMKFEDRIGILNSGLQILAKELAEDALTALRVRIAIVAFGSDAQVLQPFVDAINFQPPTLVASGGTAMGSAMDIALKLIDDEKQTLKSVNLNYYRPWIWLMSDGEPTDIGWEAVAERIRRAEARTSVNVYAVGIGDEANLDLLGKFASSSRPLRLQPGRTRDMFRWLSRSISTAATRGRVDGDPRASVTASGEQIEFEPPAWGSPQQTVPAGPDRESSNWNNLTPSSDESSLGAFLNSWPDGEFAAQARERLKRYTDSNTFPTNQDQALEALAIQRGRIETDPAQAQLGVRGIAGIAGSNRGGIVGSVISGSGVAVAGSIGGVMGKQLAEFDYVDCSVFSPSVVQPKNMIMVQVFLHLVEQANSVALVATSMDNVAKLRGAQTLQAPMRRGSLVTIVLEGRGLVVDEPIQTLVWRGEPNAVAFLCEIPEKTDIAPLHPVVRLYRNQEPIGRVLFKIEVQPNQANQQTRLTPTLTGMTARHYREAFLSYATEDRIEVLKRAQALQLANINVFQDLLSLSPGERFERKLYEKISQCDLFVLFWSRHALASKWVGKEIAHARRCQTEKEDALPDIVPVVLDDPRDAPPPELLGDRHFNDTIAALISYEQSRRENASWSWRGLFRKV